MGSSGKAPASPAEVAEGGDEMLLSVRSLRTQFGKGATAFRAVDDVSFDLRAGSSTGILGESGSGKSITVLSIMGLVPSPGFVAGGTVMFKGRELVGLSERDMCRLRGKEIAMVFQDPMTGLNPVYTIGVQLVEALRAHRSMKRRAARERAIEMLELVGIPSPERRVNDYPHSLSGGMLQRVIVAMALANEPDLLILDEPTTALDVTTQAQVLDLIIGLRGKVNTSVLLVTHDIGVVAEMCSDVIVMYCGRVMEQATVRQLLTEPKHPYSAGLLAAPPTIGMRGQRLKVIPGMVPSASDMPPGCPFAPRCPRVIDKCAEMPTLETLDDGRRVACWLY
jgi:oligopeptide/dipeptide ABC transporter ATP-binding protein